MNRKYIGTYLKQHNIPSDLRTKEIPFLSVLIEDHREKSSYTPEQLISEIEAQSRSAEPWSMFQVVTMYLTALANNASFEAVDASCMDNYGCTFGTYYAIFCFTQMVF